MGAITAVAPETAILERYDQLTKDRARLVDRIDQAETRLGTLESERQNLLPRVADGDKSASTHAALLDTGKIHMQRQLDGLRMKLGDMDRSIAEISGPRNEIFERRARESRRQRFDEAKKFLEDRVWNIHARYRTLCRERAELSEELHRIAWDPALDQAQRAQLLSFVTVGQSALGPLHINEGWTRSRGPLTQLPLPVVPSTPPDSLRHLEELK
jgi:chromosome segregation ATPase